ncbi:MAG TPA: YHYH protein [Chthonomonadaceae bacterium]|nr:YHYH protein [Chthonomonadaceae bacterium]
MKARILFILSGSTFAVLGSALLIRQAAHGQPPGPFGGAAPVQANYQPEVKIEVRDAYRYITANGIPDHITGQFPNRGNPNTISPQRYNFKVPVAPKAAAQETPLGMYPFGVAINGIPFDPGAAEFWNGSRAWQYEPLAGVLLARGGLGVDDNRAHVQPGGAYHYHGLPTALLKRLNWEKQMALVGYAADGFPIYSSYAYSDPNDPHSVLKLLKSSYRVKQGTRPGGNEGPGGMYDGSFLADYTYVAGSGDLDDCNGRTGVTPEYPNGTYYYVLTDNWPFVPRCFKGMPDNSFFRQGPPGGPGGFGGQGGRPPFGGPGGQGGQGGRPPFGGPGGFGPGGPPGPPPGFVPGDVLAKYLGLNKGQADKLDRLMKAIDALRAENFALPAFAQLKLTDAQIRKIAEGGKVREVLTDEQRKVLDANPRPGPGGPNGPPPFGGQG